MTTSNEPSADPGELTFSPACSTAIDLPENDRLRKMTEAVRLLTASLETSTVIQTIIETIPQVIPAVQACVLMLYDPLSEHLISQASVGFSPEIVNQLKLKPGESMSGYAFLHNRPVLYAGNQSIQQGIDSMSETNRALQAVLTPKPAKSVMCAPLDFKGQALGVVTVNNFTSHAAFSESDLELLQSFASQASIAIENSRLYEKQSQSLHELAELNQIISRQHHQLERAFHIHRTLSDVALQNRGLAAITQALADILGQPVIVLDLLQNVIAEALPGKTSPAAPGQSKPAPDLEPLLEALRQGVRKKNSAGITLVASNDNSFNPRIEQKVVPIRAGNDKLGHILTASLDSNSQEHFADVAIEQAATIIALEMVKEQSIFEVERRLRGEFLEELLTDTADENIASRASLLGYDPNCLYWIILADIDDFRGYIQKNRLDENTIAAFKRQILKFITPLVTRHYPKSIVTIRSDMVVIMLGVARSVAAEQSHDRAFKLTHEIKRQLAVEFSQVSFSLALSRSSAELSQFKSRYQEAMLALQIMGGTSTPGKVLDCSQLGAALLLLKIENKAELFEFVGLVLGNLIRYDRQHHSNLINTLNVYSKCNSDHQEASAQLHVHPNTLSYRLSRIEEISCRGLSRTDDWLDFQLALRLLQAYPELGDLIENSR